MKRVKTEEQKERDRVRAREWNAKNPDRHLARTRQWARDNPDKIRETNRISHLRRSYGITAEQKEAMLKEQGGCCAICKTTEPGQTGWNIDHSHATGKVRKILCRWCNLGVGHMKDSPERLRSAASYIESHR